MNRRENERCRSRCSISGTIAAFWVKLLAGSITPSPTPHYPSRPPLILRRGDRAPVCPRGPPTRRDPTKANQTRGVPFVSQHSARGEKNPNYFPSCSNLTCCDNCSARNFFDSIEREDFLAIKMASLLGKNPAMLTKGAQTHQAA